MRREGRWLQKRIALALAGMMLLNFTGCKNADQNSGKQQETEGGLYTYVPEYWEWKDGSDRYMENLSVVENRLYYSDKENRYCYLDLDRQGAEPVFVYGETDENALTDLGEGFENSVEKIFPDADGIVVIIRQKPSVDEKTATEEDWLRQRQESVYHMKKLMEDGAVAFEEDITRYIFEDPEYAYLEYAFCGEDGTIYLSNGNSYVWIFDQEGKYQNQVRLKENARMGNYIRLGVLGDKRAAVATDANEGRDMNLIAYDTKKNSNKSSRPTSRS